MYRTFPKSYKLHIKLQSAFIPKRGDIVENLKGNHTLLDEIARGIAADTELVQLFQKVRTESFAYAIIILRGK